MAKAKKFDEKKLPELIRLYKDGATISELKERYSTYGNPLVRRLKEAGVYKAARKPKDVIGRAVSVYVPAKKRKPAKAKPKAARKPAEKARTAMKKAPKASTPSPAPESPVSSTTAPVDPLTKATPVYA